MNKTDLELIAESVGGQTRAFDLLVTRYQDQLYNALFQILRNREDARDLTQEAFVMAWTKLQSFRGESTFFTWLFRIAYNLTMTRKRKKRIQTTSPTQSNSLAEFPNAQQNSPPSEPIELEERQKIVQSALQSLPEEFRTVIILKEMEDLKYDQIADVLDLPIGTVRSRLHRARLILREKLERVLSREEGTPNVNYG